MPEFNWNYRATAHTMISDVEDIKDLLRIIKTSEDKLEIVTAIDAVKIILNDASKKMEKILEEFQNPGE